MQPMTAELSHRIFAAALLALAGVCLLVSARPVAAAGDPVGHGTLRLRISPQLKHLLVREGVKMSRRSFSIESGTLDPLSGDGDLTLENRLRFRKGSKKVVFRTVTARLGRRGLLKTGGVKLFRLRGRAVVRDGFGAEVGDVKMKLTRSGAAKLNRRLGLHSLRRMRAGELKVSEQPGTVEVTGGTVHLVPNPTLTLGSGTVASKLPPHCIDFINGNLPLVPTVKSGPPQAPFYDFPVSGGTIGPAGSDGSVEVGGGLRIVNNNSNASAPFDRCDNEPPPLARLDQTELSFNLLDDYVSSHLNIAQLSQTVPTAGDQGTGIGFDLDPAASTVAADPAAHTVTVSGLVARLNKGGALFLNQTFRQPSTTFSQAYEFASGDLFGTVDLAVGTR